MWELGTAAAALIALLVPADPPQAPPLPPRSEPAPACVVPVGGTTLEACPRAGLRPPVLCVVPVTGFAPPALEPECPDPVPHPRARIVPISP